MNTLFSLLVISLPVILERIIILVVKVIMSRRSRKRIKNLIKVFIKSLEDYYEKKDIVDGRGYRLLHINNLFEEIKINVERYCNDPNNFIRVRYIDSTFNRLDRLFDAWKGQYNQNFVGETKLDNMIPLTYSDLMEKFRELK